MHDISENSDKTKQSTIESFDDLLDYFESLLSSYSVRTNHVLHSLMESYTNKRLFIEDFVRFSRKKILSLKNCGKATVTEIQDLQSKIDISLLHPSLVSIEPKSFLELITPYLNTISVRGRNAFRLFYYSFNDSLPAFYAAISNKDFDPKSLHNVGRKTVVELEKAFELSKSILEGLEVSIEGVTFKPQRSLSSIGIPVKAQKEINELEDSLGYFPLFATVKAYLDTQKSDIGIIIDSCLLIYENQTLLGRHYAASQLKLTVERIRQKKNKLIGRLSKFIASIRAKDFLDKCPYSYQMTHINKFINSTEGTNYNLNFINWVIGTTYEEVVVIGDIMKALSSQVSKNNFLCLVPADLIELFNFKGFLADMDKRLSEKRINEEKVPIKEIINQHLKVKYCEDELPSIEIACRSILYLHYPVEIDLGQVYFKANARKNNSTIIEEILRNTRHPLTLEELYNEFIYQYPERYTEIESFRGNISHSQNIVPIGRSSTYSLKEWNGGKQRGGTIRQIVCEYLNNLPEPIATETDVCAYVRLFRPTSSNRSICSNLMLESTHKVRVFIKDNVRYYGLSGVSYDPAYCSLPEKRSVKESMRKLEDFIITNGRYPYATKTEGEEHRLYRFINHRRVLCSKGTIPQEEIEEWNQFEEKYKEFIKHRSRKHYSRGEIGDITNV